MQDSLKVNVFCAMSKKRVYGPSFFFQEGTVNSEVYFAMLQNWLMKKLHEEESSDFIFQQDRALLHGCLKVKQYLNTTMPDSSDVPDRLTVYSYDDRLGVQTSRHVTSSSGDMCKASCMYLPFLESWMI